MADERMTINRLMDAPTTMLRVGVQRADPYPVMVAPDVIAAKPQINNPETLPRGNFAAMRQAWRDVVDPSSQKELASERYGLLLRTSVAWGYQDMIEGHTDFNRGKFERHAASVQSFHKFVARSRRHEIPAHRISINEEPFAVTSEWAKIPFDVSKSSYVACNSKNEQYAILANRPESYLVMPILFGGFEYGSEVAAILGSIGKLADFMLVSYSSGAYDLHRRYDYHRFKDGRSMCHKLLVPPGASGILNRNMSNPVLLVDDSVGDTGITSWAIASWLRERFGFAEITEIDLWSRRIYLL